MGALMRGHDWSSSAPGEPASWPATLKTAVRILLTSNNPMLIWWGEELLQFYNDAFRQTMGAERHPAALGQAGRECWTDVWPIIGPDVAQVMQGRGAVCYEKRLVPLVRHGRHEEVWWAYGYSQLEDESDVRGVLVICNDCNRRRAASCWTRPRVDPERIAQASDVIARQVRHMTELVDDLLDVSRVTRGLVDLQRVPVDIKSVASSAIEQARPLIEGRKHALTTHIASAPAFVLGDRKRLVQVVVNLLNNAAKYTAPGGAITLAVDVEDDAVRFSVADNGSGIDPLLLPKIFDLFTQAERTPDRGQGGLGLGLALVKSMVGLHGGRIEARSDGPGQGSVFRAYLPRTAGTLEPAAGAVARLAAGSVAPIRIMVVDDNLDAAESLATLLEAVGHQVSVAGDGAGALERAARDVPDVFILDIGLPGIDGFELARRLRAKTATRHCRLIALSGYGQAQDMAMSAQAGFDHHLVKPVETARLLALLDAGTDGDRFGTLT